ncbi:hypothetical protein [Stenotrophomonas maltophilia group sp. Smal32]|uniref:hypothetical protein n=1 Tax=Stenotrophomonas maltophilia group sp. Smal32 TaxID=3377164 RepID=UPI0018D405BA|nr:hypothetical protein [Stenotrophomonas maltophilia]MBH1744826.1 hypothetical protein [Stenotrophomonas maltophilia]
MTAEFQEIGHSGGRIEVRVMTHHDSGRRAYQLRYVHRRAVPAILIQLYALPQGIALEPVDAAGIGEATTPPSVPGAWLVMICSDSTGQFGHRCPRCEGYWRSGPWPAICPYCRFEAPPISFLSNAQNAFIRQYCARMSEAFDSDEDGVIEIDMDAVADAVGADTPKPAFYVSEQSQQHQFDCAACRSFNDVLGRYAYCSSCGTRNDLAVFKGESVSAIREILNSNNRAEDAVRSAVSAFDSFAGQYAKQLAVLVPMTNRRLDRLRRRFHNFDETASMFSSFFDIDIGRDLRSEDLKFIALQFHRRHVFEHNGGEVDEVYLRESGDTSVKLKQVIRESSASAHRLLDLLGRVANNLHAGFHSIIPVRSAPIEWAREHGAL